MIFSARLEPHRSGSWRLELSLGEEHVARTQGMPRPVAESVLALVVKTAQKCGATVEVTRPIGVSAPGDLP